MPIDVEKYFNDAVNSLSGGLLSNIFGNTLSVSLLLSCLIFIIISAVYSETSRFKTFFYIFWSLFVTLLIHHSVVKGRIKKSSSDDMVANISGGIDELQPLETL